MGKHSCSWIERLYSKMLVLSKAIYTSSTIPVSMSTPIFAEMEKLILKFIWNCKGPQIAKTISKKRIELGETL